MMGADKAERNRAHHFKYYKDDYKNLPRELATEMFRLVEWYKRVGKIKEAMRKTDISRRENAVSMGVGIAESDAVYNFDEAIRGLPKLMDEMEKYAKEYGVDLTKGVK